MSAFNIPNVLLLCLLLPAYTKSIIISITCPNNNTVIIIIIIPTTVAKEMPKYGRKKYFLSYCRDHVYTVLCEPSTSVQ